MVWDPKGLLGNAPKQAGLLERKLALRKAAQAQAGLSTSGPPLKKVSTPGGLGVGEEEEGFTWDEFVGHLEATYLKVNLKTAGLRLLHADPPIFSVDGFLDAETCDALAAAGEASGLMQESTIGKGALGSADNTSSSRRTSSSLLLSSEALAGQPALKALSERMQKAVRTLLPGQTWSPTGRLPPSGEVCFEALQLAHYQQGQHFLAHEDGFPVPMAQDNHFQRAATVLVYLNSVAAGGRTRFEHLNLSITPEQGRAVLFFPAFADGKPDSRTLHTAEDATDSKWVAQQWVAKGLAVERAPEGPVSPVVAALAGVSLPNAAGKVKTESPFGTARANLSSRVSEFVADIKPLVSEDESPAENLRRMRLTGKKKKVGKVGKPPGKGFGPRA